MTCIYMEHLPPEKEHGVFWAVYQYNPERHEKHSPACEEHSPAHQHRNLGPLCER